MVEGEREKRKWGKRERGREERERNDVKNEFSGLNLKYIVRRVFHKNFQF